MGRLTSDEYAKRHGKRAGDQLRKERMGQFRATERKRAQAVFNPFTSRPNPLAPRQSRPRPAPRPSARQQQAARAALLGNTPNVLTRGLGSRSPINRMGQNAVPSRTLFNWHFETPAGRKQYLDAYKRLPDTPRMAPPGYRGVTKLDALADAISNPNLNRSRDVLKHFYSTEYTAGANPKNLQEAISAANDKLYRYVNPDVIRGRTRQEEYQDRKGPQGFANWLKRNFDSNLGYRGIRHTQELGQGARNVKTGYEKAMPEVVAAAGRLADRGRQGLADAQSKSSNPQAQAMSMGLNLPIVKAAVKDAAEIVPATPLFAYQLGRDVLNNPVDAVRKDIVDPYVELVKHPRRTFSQRPVTSTLMVTGAYSALGKGLGAGARAASGGRVGDLARPRLRDPLTGVEVTRRFSPNLLTQMLQTSRDVAGTKIVDKGKTLGEIYAEAGVEVPKGVNPNRRVDPVAEPRLPNARGYRRRFDAEAKRQANEEADISKLDKQEGRGDGREARPGTSEVLRKVGPTITYVNDRGARVTERFPYDTQVTKDAIRLSDGSEIPAERIVSVRMPRGRAAVDRGRAIFSLGGTKLSKRVENDVVGLYNAGSIGRRNDLMTELQNERKRILDGQQRGQDEFGSSLNGPQKAANKDNLAVIDAAISKLSRGKLDVPYILDRVQWQRHKQTSAESEVTSLPALNEDAALRRPLLEAGIRRGLIERTKDGKFIETTDRIIEPRSVPVEAFDKAASQKAIERRTVPVREYSPNASDINSRPWFHGSNDLLKRGEINAFLGDEVGLFGPGTYMTDNPRVARGYARNRSRRKGSPTVTEFRLNLRKALDLEGPLNSDWVDAIRSAAQRLEEQFDLPEDGGLKAIDAHLESGRATNESLYKELQQEIADASVENSLPKYEFAELLGAIREDLSRKGYDALTHRGGGRVGKVRHQVVILLKDSATEGRNPVAVARPSKALFAGESVPEVGTARTTRSETPAEMLRRAKEARDSSEGVSNERLTQLLEEDGVDPNDLAYVSARADKGGFGDYWQRDTKDRGRYASPFSFTGESALRRSSRSDAQALQDQNVRIRVVAAAIRASDRFRRGHALEDSTIQRLIGPAEYQRLVKDGYKEDGVLTAKQAQVIIDHADELGIPLGAMRVISKADMKRFDTTAADILNRESAGPGLVEADVEASLVESLFGNDVSNASFGDRANPFASSIQTKINKDVNNVVLVPGEMLKAFLEHNLMGPGTLPIIGAAFRRAVLPFSARWFGGNIVEGEMRKALAGIVPVFDIVRSRMDTKSMAVLKAQAPELFDLMRFSTEGGRMFGSQLHNTTRTTGGLKAQYQGEAKVPGVGTVKSPLISATYNVVHTPITKLTDASFKLNDIYESLNERQVRGKAWSKELRDFTGSWRQSLKAQEDTIMAIAKHWESDPKLALAKARQFGRYVDETLGKYSKFSPPMRRFIQGYAPFVAWYLNSVKFFTYLLPVKHPVVTALLASTRQNLAPDIKEWIAGEGPSRALGSGRYNIDLGDGNVLDVGHVTPAGAFQSGLLQGAAGQLVPQLDSILAISEGNSPVGGRQLRDSQGEPITDKGVLLLLAINSLMLSTIPGLSVYQRIREGGKSSAGDSTWWNPKAKEGAYDKGLALKMLSPINVIHYGGDQGGSGGFSFPGSSSGFTFPGG